MAQDEKSQDKQSQDQQQKDQQQKDQESQPRKAQSSSRRGDDGDDQKDPVTPTRTETSRESGTTSQKLYERLASGAKMWYDPEHEETKRQVADGEIREVKE